MVFRNGFNDLLNISYITKDVANKSITLYPTFTDKKYNIEFNNNYLNYGGEVGDEFASEYFAAMNNVKYNDLTHIQNPYVEQLTPSTDGHFTGRGGALEFRGWSTTDTPISSNDYPEYPYTNGYIDVTRLLADAASGDTVTLYAHWRLTRYNIDYENDNPSIDWSTITADVPTWFDASQTEGNKPIPGVGDSGAPVRAGAEFLYWSYQFYDDKAGQIPNANKGTTSVAMDVTQITGKGRRLKMTANWHVFTGMLIFDPNGGTGERVYIDLGDGKTSYPIPNVSFTFGDKVIDHWSTDPNDANGIVYTGVVTSIYREDIMDDFIVYAIPGQPCPEPDAGRHECS